jgi:hypothetical protein
MELFRNTDKEILLMTKPDGYVDPELNEDTKNFLKRGGVIKNLYDAGSDFKIKIDGVWKNVSKENFPDFIDKLVIEGEEIRLTESVKQNILICDRKVVFISLVDPTISRYNRSDIIIKNENYASSMADYFNTCWEKAYRVEEFKRRRGGTNS